MHTGAAVGKVVDDSLQLIVFAGAVTPEVRSVRLPRPGLNIGTGVSSACSTDRLRSISRIASTSGASFTPQAPTHCANVERGSASPARAKMPSWRYSGA